MNAITITACDGLTYRRISKAKAHKIFNELGIAFACPVKANLACPWIGRPFAIRYDESDLKSRDERFEIWSNEVRWYNCNHEMGYYPAYYEVIA